VRDYLEKIQWNKQPPVPTLPDAVIRQTSEKYEEALKQLTEETTKEQYATHVHRQCTYSCHRYGQQIRL
jgi:hypothetical protein